MKKVLNEGIKDEMVFKCKLCNCEWSDDEWNVKDETNKFNHMLFMGTSASVQLPTSSCPHCGWTSQDVRKQSKEG